MPLQFILGSSGSGKSRYLYETVIRESLAAPKENFLVLVPEQFTMEIQRNLTELHPRKGILNIDVLSFQRLALRVLEDLGADRRRVLEETGKNLVIRRCAMERKKELTLLGGSMEKNGYISQVKSMISELAQYRIEPEQMDGILEGLEGQPRLYYKWKDIGILYQAFQERMAKDYGAQRTAFAGGTSGGAGGACGGVRPPLRLHDRLGQLYGLYPDSACPP